MLRLSPRAHAAILLACLASLLGATAGASEGGPEGSTPVILISLDTLRAQALGPYGSSWPTSPVMDRLSRDFFQFAQGISQAPWTSPSHMSLFTSQYPGVHRVNIAEARLAREKETLAEVLKKHGWGTHGFYSNAMLSPKFGFDQGFDAYHLAGRKHGYQSTQSALTWLDRAPLDAPFFLFLHYNDPHIPYRAPGPYHRMFDQTYEGPMDGTLKTVGMYIHQPIGERDLHHVHSLYRDEVRYVDGELGRVLRRVKDRGLYDRSLIIITADHGEEFKEHGHLTHEQTLFEELLRVPLLIKFPARMELEPRLVWDQVRLIDLMPTILDVTGVPIPEGSVQGSSLLPLARGVSGAGRAHARCFSEAKDTRAVSIRGERWKYIFDRRNGKRYLYDLQADPAETRNLEGQERQVAAQLHHEVLEYIQGAKDGWHLRLRGPFRFHGRLETDGRFVEVHSVGAEPQRDLLEAAPDGREIELRFQASQGNDKMDGVNFKLEPPDAALRLVILEEDQASRDEQLAGIRIGRERSAVSGHPILLNGPRRSGDPDVDLEDRLTVKFTRSQVPPGLYVWRIQPPPEEKAELDEEIREELRSLGYLDF